MSTNYREMLLAAYSKGDEFDFNQKDGLIHLWSFALRKYPEFTFTCQSEVTSAILYPFDPNIVIGGTHSGQIFLLSLVEHIPNLLYELSFNSLTLTVLFSSFLL